MVVIRSKSSSRSSGIQFVVRWDFNLDMSSMDRTSAVGPVKVFVLIVDTGVNETSLTRRIVKSSLEVLTAPAYEVTITDLAKDGWLDPISANDFTRVSNPIHINVQNEQAISPLIQKIQDEQNRLLQCELFLIFGPLTWFGLPSLFFAWWERVVTLGKCYGPGQMYQRGAFARKRALIVLASAERPESYGRDTTKGCVEEILYPITHGRLYPVGFKVHRTQTLYFVAPATDDEVLQKWQTAVRDLEERTYIMFNDPNNYSNWLLSTPEKDRRNDFELITRQGDMSLQEATMKLNAG
jgi:NAD(P)H dehydrogenase (quinone)